MNTALLFPAVVLLLLTSPLPGRAQVNREADGGVSRATACQATAPDLCLGDDRFLVTLLPQPPPPDGTLVSEREEARLGRWHWPHQGEAHDLRIEILDACGDDPPAYALRVTANRPMPFTLTVIDTRYNIHKTYFNPMMDRPDEAQTLRLEGFNTCP